MIAKIIQGKGFHGVVNYVLNKDKAQLLATEGLRTLNKGSIIHSFITQSKLHSISKPVAHIALAFSVHDKEKLSDVFMQKIASQYMSRMGYKDTQYLLVRHNDRDHPHCHLIINRIDQFGNRISDQNERFRSIMVCREISQLHGLYIAKGKENVKEYRLREPDRTKYQIYNALKTFIPKTKNWDELNKMLNQNGIQTEFKFKGSTNQIDGVRFSKNGICLSGSKIDRQFSYSKIESKLSTNNRSQVKPSNLCSQSNVTRSQIELLPDFHGMSFNSITNTGDDDEDNFKKKRKKRDNNQQMSL